MIRACVSKTFMIIDLRLLTPERLRQRKRIPGTDQPDLIRATYEPKEAES
jgi:hypothetical protein